MISMINGSDFEKTVLETILSDQLIQRLKQVRQNNKYILTFSSRERLLKKQENDLLKECMRK